MPVEAAEPVTTSSLPPKSIFDTPEFEQSLSEALAKDGKIASAPVEPKQEGDAPAPEPKATEPKPDAKPAEAKAATPDAEDEVPPDIKSPAAQSSWKKLKESKKAIEAELGSTKKEFTTLKAELEALRVAAKTPAQKANLADDPEYQSVKKALEAKDKELNEYSERLRLLEVEKHPKFEAYFKSKVDAQMEMAKDIGGDKLVEALRLPIGEYRNEKLRELAVDIDPLRMNELGAVIVNLKQIELERQSEIAKARENYAQIQAEQKQQSEKQRATIEGAFKSIAQEVTDKEKGLAAFQLRDGDDEWNRGVNERTALAKAAFEGSLKPEDQARLAHWGAAAPVLLTQLNAIQKESAEKIAALEKQVADLRAVAPNPGGARQEADAPIPSDKKGMDALMEEISKVLPTMR